MADTEAERHIARIDALTANGRTNWFGLMAYLAFALVTVLAVEDVDFFDPSRNTDLPLIGVAIPTFSFFVFAPILGAALYVYLHLTIRKATEALCAAPHRIGDDPLESRIKPWLLNDMVLRMRGSDADDRPAAQTRPLDPLATLSALTLIWLAGPALMALMWVRSWPAHDWRVSLAIAACLLVTLYAGLTTWTKLQADLAGDDNTLGVAERVVGVAFAAMLLFVTTLQQTHFGMPQLDGTVRLASADLAGARLSVLPPDQADPVAARHRFRTEWCARQGLATDICGRARLSGADPLPNLAKLRQDYCNSHEIPDCTAWFDGREDDFDREWRGLRRATLDAQDKPDLSGRDLRGADLSFAELAGVTLRGAQMQGADLQGANLEGAVLTCDRKLLYESIFGETFAERCRAGDPDAPLLGVADLSGADLQSARLTDADLRYARLTEAELGGARLEGADLRFAALEGADLSLAWLEGADLGRAKLERVNLGGARLGGADLSSTHMHGADLRLSGLDGADLREAQMEGADLAFAGLEGADLREAVLVRAYLVGARLKRADLSRTRLEGAVLRFAGLEGADLGGAYLQGADLGGARLEKSNLEKIRLEGANLRKARLQSASWLGTVLGASPAHAADFRDGTGLSQSGLSSLIGDATTLLPETLKDGSAPYVCSCWASHPPGLEHLIALFAGYGVSEADLRDPEFGWFCRPGERPRKTGTPWPLDTPTPDQMEGWEQDLIYWSPVMADRRAAPYCDDPASAK